MQIGILQTGHAPDALIAQTGDYPAMFARLLDGHGLTFRTWAVVDGEFPESIHDAEGWLITGSRHGAYEDHPWIPPLEDFIRDGYAARVPLVGICFGHQIIAQALGGKVEKYPGGWSVGPTDYDFGDETLTLNAWHQDQVVEKPRGRTGDRLQRLLRECSPDLRRPRLHRAGASRIPAGVRGRADEDPRTRALCPTRCWMPRRRGSTLHLHDRAIATRIAEFFKHPRAR